MSDTYQIIINRLGSGITKESAVAKLMQLLNVSDEKILALLASPNFIIKKGLDSASAEAYRTALQDCGCICTIEPEHLTHEIEHAQPVNEPTQSIEGKVIPVAQKIADQTAPIIDKTFNESKAPVTDTRNSKTAIAGRNQLKEYIAEFPSFSRRKKIIHVGIACLLCLVVLVGISGKPHHRSSEQNSEASSDGSNKENAIDAVENFRKQVRDAADSSNRNCANLARSLYGSLSKMESQLNEAEKYEQSRPNIADEMYKETAVYANQYLMAISHSPACK